MLGENQNQTQQKKYRVLRSAPPPPPPPGSSFSISITLQQGQAGLEPLKYMNLALCVTTVAFSIHAADTSWRLCVFHVWEY